MVPAGEPIISVGVLTDKKIHFELYGDFKVFGFKNSFSGIFNTEVKDDVIICTGPATKLEITDEVIFEPQDPLSESFVLRDVVIGIDFHWERREKQRFNHSLKLVRDGNNVVAINLIPLEHYLFSVISSEMNPKSSLQLLKAQAVISRSWIIVQLEKSKTQSGKDAYKSEYESGEEYIRWYGREEHGLYDVCADDHCQRFQGVAKMAGDKAREAVIQTRGVVILSDNKICDTRYSKSCGGITEGFENVWEPVKFPCLSSVIDYKYEPENYNFNFSDETNARKWILSSPPAFCNTGDKKILSQILTEYDQGTTDFFRWKIEYSQEELSAIIKEKSGKDFGKILDLIPVERGSSARLIKLKIVGTEKTLIIGKELEIRRILSHTHLYSSAIVIDKELGKAKVPEKFIIHGAGWGHGVGLCQIGAAVMAERGHQFDEILLHYFSNASIKKIY